MMLEEAGYNPFMEGDAGEGEPKPLEGGHGFLEGEPSYYDNRRNNSFLELPSQPSSTPLSPSLSSSFSPFSPSLRANSSKSLSASSNASGSSSPMMSLRSSANPLSSSPLLSSSSLVTSTNSANSSPHSSLRVITQTDSLENPFFQDPSLPSIEVSQPSEGNDIYITPAAPTALPPSSPLSKSSSTLHRRTLSLSSKQSPPVKNALSSSSNLSSSSSSHGRTLSGSYQMQRSPSSTPTSPVLKSPSSEPPPAPLYTHKSFQQSTSTYVVSMDKVEWVPDEYSNSCEQCGNEFTFIRRRHHCRACGHLFCGECIVKMTLPPPLGYLNSQKTCLGCGYKVMRERGHLTATNKRPEGLSLGQKLSGKMQNWVYRMAGMYEGGKFDRVAASIAPLQFTTYSIGEVLALKIPSYDGYMMPTRVYIPKGFGPFPVLVYIPGGAFVLGDIESSAVIAICKELCYQVGCIVFCVGYRQAPEQRYPVAWEDCYAAVKWLYESSALDLTKLEKDPKIVVCGEGSGGLLAAAVCHMARDRATPPIKFQLLITPWLNLSTLNVDKWDESYVVTKDLMKWVLKQVFTEVGDRDKQYVSPILAQSLANLPPTKVITAGYDPMQYDGEEYASKIRDEGGNASVTKYENSFHGFVGNTIDSYSESEEAIFECVVCLREVFGMGPFPQAARRSENAPSFSKKPDQENYVGIDDEGL